jgi:hypothetical protein
MSREPVDLLALIRGGQGRMLACDVRCTGRALSGNLQLDLRLITIQLVPSARRRDCIQNFAHSVKRASTKSVQKKRLKQRKKPSQQSTLIPSPGGRCFSLTHSCDLKTILATATSSMTVIAWQRNSKFQPPGRTVLRAITPACDFSKPNKRNLNRFNRRRR